MSQHALVLELEGDRQEFAATQQANQYLLVKYIDDLSLGGFATVKAVTALTVGQVLRHDRERLEAYLIDHGSDEDYVDGLYSALSACWSGETMLPLEPSSPSPTLTSTTPASDSPSTDDSFSRATKALEESDVDFSDPKVQEQIIQKAQEIWFPG